MIQKPIQTSPTGFSGVPPPGPAIPVVETPISLPNFFATPSAICNAVNLLTAPCFSSADGFTLRSFILTSFQRSEEHTSELQSRGQIVCRLLLEKKKEQKKTKTQLRVCEID